MSAVYNLCTRAHARTHSKANNISSSRRRKNQQISYLLRSNVLSSLYLLRISSKLEINCLNVSRSMTKQVTPSSESHIILAVRKSSLRYTQTKKSINFNDWICAHIKIDHWCWIERILDLNVIFIIQVVKLWKELVKLNWLNIYV